MIKNSILPNEYQEVEYIESTGTQYIDLNYVPNDTSGIRIKASAIDRTDGVAIGVRNSTSTDSRWYVGITYSGSPAKYNIYGAWNTLDTIPDRATWTIGVPFVYQLNFLNNRKRICNDVEYTPIAETLSNIDKSTYLFCANMVGQPKVLKKCKIYYCQISEGFNIVRNLIPCYRKSDNESGMYDTINNVFYSNIGEGTFNKGSNITNKEIVFVHSRLLPLEYQQVEYIESTGTQYIDTGIIGDNNTGFEIKFYTYDRMGQYDYGTIFAARTASRNRDIALTTYGTNNGTGTLRWNTTSNDAGITNNKIVEVKLKNEIYKGYDGTTIDLSNVDSFTTPNSLSIFALNQRGTISQYGNLRLYYFKIYNGNILTRDFVPCYRKSDNEIGLYDLVNKTFYTNQGTGVFHKGQNVKLNNIDKIYNNNELVFEQGYTREQQGIPPLTTTHQAIGKDLKQYQVYGQTTQARLPLEYQELDYIESDGSQYIDTGLIGKSGYTLETELLHTQVALGTAYQYFAGYAYTGSNDRLYFTRQQIDAAWMGYTYGSNNSSTSKLESITANTWYTYKSMMKANDQGFWVNGVKKVATSYSALSYDASNPKYIYMFACNYTNGVTAYCYAKCKYAKWYDENDNLIRYFIPCYRKSDNVVGMYDTVNGVFYTNQGTGTFIKGNDVVVPPTVDNPVKLISVGDLVTDTSDINYGKYKIPITISDGTNSTTTNIYLDAPLRKIGTYADYIDFKNQKIIRKVDELTITGNESDWEKVGSYNLFRFPLSNSQIIPELEDFTIEKCNYYSCDNIAATGTNIGCSAYWSSSLGKTYFRLRPETTYSSVGYFKIFVQGLNTSGKPLKIAYPRYTELEESFTLPNIPSYSGTTIYSIGTDITPTNMYIKYKGH